MIFCDYPAADYHHRKDSVTMKIKGDSRLNCRLMIIKDGHVLQVFKVNDQNNELTGSKRQDGNIEYTVAGNQKIKITWKGK